MLDSLLLKSSLLTDGFMAIEGAKNYSFGKLGVAMMGVNSRMLMADAVGSTTSTIDGFTKGGQLIGYALAVLFFVLGALQYMVGGEESMRKAKKRWLGCAVGLIVCVGAYLIRDYIKAKANFS
ncbi:pilin [Enterococcus raffinosus]|uniref:pilin n=1 Tax=Enterococcus raffinosus TaxID=71452 RepID=UPI0028924E70|nr:pilin [Enterococcus raffinosus]MDT2525130.1 pilin [Enterococcus raffinosus]MDT2592485.1 pilin [Enterococcus raffinosus]